VRRPLAVIIIGWLYIAAGVIGIAYHATEIHTLVEPELILALTVRALAIVCGVFLLRGHSWARWLAVVWMAYHVVLGAMHEVFQLVMHALLLIVIAYFLFRPRVSAYFRAV
jgi:hypothetical protein